MHNDLQNWVQEIGARDEFEDKEWNGIVTPLGALSERITVDFGWRAEGLVVLAWALGRADLPPYDEQADGPTVGDTIGFLDDSAAGLLLLSPRLRSFADLEWIANLTLAVHWRLRNYTLEPEAIDFRQLAANCTWATFPIDDLTLIEGDLSLRGKPIHHAGGDLIEECSSIIRERQQAANWLIGEQAIYSEVACDT
jgi:hypothetical protein